MRVSEFNPSQPAEIITTYGDEEGRGLVSFLWIRGTPITPLYEQEDAGFLLPFDRDEVFAFDPELFGPFGLPTALHAVFFQSVEKRYPQFYPLRAHPEQRHFVSTIMRSYVTYSQSPPKSKTLVELSRKSTGPVVVGSVIGTTAAAMTCPWAAFITVPAGIIVVGAASGIADGLRDGLADRVRAWCKK
jgi:hypothetical protein